MAEGRGNAQCGAKSPLGDTTAKSRISSRPAKASNERMPGYALGQE
jgi:hypothetical protein